MRAFKIYARIFRNQPLSLIGAIIISSFAVIALLAPILAPPTSRDPYISPYAFPPSYLPPPPTLPSSEHPFGTLRGYDLYYGCIWGVRIAFYTGILTTLIAVAVGLIIGSIAGYFESIVDEILMRFTDAFFAIPGICFVLLVIVAMPSRWEIPLGLFNLTIALSSIDKIIIALAIIGWPPYARLVRGEIKKVKQQDFVEAAKAVGCSRLRILTKHILPCSINPVFILAFMNIGGVVLAASTVSFLGFGPRVGYAEWGSIISNAKNYLAFTSGATVQYALLAFIPTAFLSTFILGWSLLGDSLQYLIDPTLGRK
jgi:peptide/nickel transport system permease protein